MAAANIFPIKNNILVCIVDHYSKFPVVKKADGLLADCLITVAKIVFTGFGLPMKFVSDASTNFISDKFK